MQANRKKSSGICFRVEQAKNCANKGRKTQDFPPVSGDFISAMQFSIHSYCGGNAALWHCLLVCSQSMKNAVCQGRAQLVPFNLDNPRSSCYLFWTTKGYVPVKGTYPYCQQSRLATAIILFYKTCFTNSCPDSGAFLRKDRG